MGRDMEKGSGIKFMGNIFQNANPIQNSTNNNKAGAWFTATISSVFPTKII